MHKKLEEYIEHKLLSLSGGVTWAGKEGMGRGRFFSVVFKMLFDG